MIKDELGKRMKTYYEQIPKTKLMRRVPVAIRIDGKAFHTFTKGLQKPFDDILIDSMQETMKYLCQNIQGCVFGYTQSDEITLILIDYQTLRTDAWFDYEVQKMCSIAASMATMKFNRAFTNLKDKTNFDFNSNNYIEKQLYLRTLCEASLKGAMFDARCFNIPKEEVCNLIYWRQVDAKRNSVQMVGRTYFSDKELHKKGTSDIKDMLLEKGIDWNILPSYKKWGSACIKSNEKWIIDNEMPLLIKEDRQYVERFIYIEDGE